jgi:hypothetical protein
MGSYGSETGLRPIPELLKRMKVMGVVPRGTKAFPNSEFGHGPNSEQA